MPICVKWPEHSYLMPFVKGSALAMRASFERCISRLRFIPAHCPPSSTSIRAPHDGQCFSFTAVPLRQREHLKNFLGVHFGSPQSSTPANADVVYPIHSPCTTGATSARRFQTEAAFALSHGPNVSVLMLQERHAMNISPVRSSLISNAAFPPQHGHGFNSVIATLLSAPAAGRLMAAIQTVPGVPQE